MVIEKRLDDILDTKSKVRILRLFVSKREDFIASGREVARLVELTPPAAHTALKELYNRDILKREIIGRQHLYRINSSSRIVKDILQPAFQKERSIKEDIADFLLNSIKHNNIKKNIASIILYGSLARGETHGKSDCDIAVIVKDAASKKQMEDLFTDKISDVFYEYFGIHLDAYIKTHKEFTARLKKNLSPVSTLMKSYMVIYGKEPIDYK